MGAAIRFANASGQIEHDQAAIARFRRPARTLAALHLRRRRIEIRNIAPQPHRMNDRRARRDFDTMRGRRRDTGPSDGSSPAGNGRDADNKRDHAPKAASVRHPERCAFSGGIASHRPVHNDKRAIAFSDPFDHARESASGRLDMRALALALALAPLPAIAALPVGTPAPDFTTQGALAGKTFNFTLSRALKRGPVVLYFFPKSFTPGCTIEAHDFAEAADAFKRAGATLIGVAGDSIDELSRFSVEECRNKFAVAVATPGMIKGYDVALPQMTARSNRTSYVIGRDGRIAYAYTALNPAGHVANTLQAVRTMRSAKAR